MVRIDTRHEGGSLDIIKTHLPGHATLIARDQAGWGMLTITVSTDDLLEAIETEFDVTAIKRSDTGR